MSVFERPKGSGNWYLSVTVNGRRVRKAIKEATTRRQAVRAERILRDEIYENRYGDGGQRLFTDFVEKSYKPFAQEHKRGYNVELSILKALTAKFGKQKLIEVTPEAVEQFKRDRAAETTKRGKERAKSTVNRDIAVLAAVFKLAVNFGEVKENPVSRIKYYGNLNSRERVLSEDEEIILFEKIKDDVRMSRQIEILLYTGMRRGELFKLEWRDIVLTEDGGFINFRKEITKTAKARDVPMIPHIKAIFEAMRGETGDVQPTDKIFSGLMVEASRLTTKFRKVCDKLGFTDLTVHSLRHTFSTRCEKYGVGAFAQKALLGHAKLSMTDRYTHLSKETLKASLSGMEQQTSRTKDTSQKKEATEGEKRPNLLAFKKN